MGDGQNSTSIFDAMAANGGKVPSSYSASPNVSPDTTIPKPVVDPRLDKQSPDQQASSITGVPTHLGGTATVDQLRSAVVPPAPAPQEGTVFDAMAEEQQKQNQAAQQVAHPQAADQQKKENDNATDNAIRHVWGLAGKAVSYIPDWMVPAQALELKRQFQEHPAEVAGVAKQMAETPLVHLQGVGTEPARLLELMKQNRESDKSVLEGLPTGLVPSDAEFEEQVKKDFPKTYGIGKGIGKLAEGLTTPENLALLASMPEAKAAPYLSKLATLFFTGQMGKGTWDAALDTAKNWDSLSPADRAERLTEIFGQGTMTALSAMHLLGKGEVEAEPKVSKDKKTVVRPTAKTVAGVSVPIPASAQERGGGFARFAEQFASPAEKRTFLTEETKPAATKAAVSALSRAAERKIATQNALADGTPVPEENEEEAGKYTTPDQITDALRATANKTYNKARDMSVRELADWQQRYEAAVARHRAEVDSHNQQVADWNKDNPDNPLDPMGVDVRPESLGMEEKPKTFDELRAAIDEARGRTDSRHYPPDVVTKARDVELPKAEKELDDWFKDREDQISNAEYEGAKSLWRDAGRFNDIAERLRGKLAKGTLTGNDIRGLEPFIVGKARRWNQAAGTDAFRRLVGDEAYQNLQDVAKLFDPIDRNNPLYDVVKSAGQFTLRGLLGMVLGLGHGAGTVGFLGGEIVGGLGEKLVNHILFDPEFGSSFRALSEATMNALQTGTAVPRAILAKMVSLVRGLKERYQASPLSREEGAVSLGGVTPRRTGDVQINPNADMRTAPNLEHDLRGFEDAKKESDEGRLPEGMSLLQRAQQLKEQYMAEAAKSASLATGSGKTENHVAGALEEFQRMSGKAPINQTKVEVDPNVAAVADAFEEMKHEPDNPQVKESYDALIKELLDQKAFLESKGYTFSLSDKDPYTSYEQMMDDIINNKHLTVWTGGNPLAEGHPLAQDLGGGWTGNTVLRGVHDVMGHAAGENDFSETGEENAYNLHKQSFSEKALPALTTETKGQTSWFFNNRGVREGAPLGQFAEQKAGLLPQFRQVPSQELAEYMNKNRGFTLNGAEGFMKNKTGYSVAGEYKNLDEVIPGQNITPAAIEEYRNRPAVKEALKDPRNSIGGWFYKGNAHLEISRLYQDRDAAIDAAKRFNQTAIFDHATKSEIPTGGTAADEAAAAAAAGSPMQSMAAVAPALDREASEIPTRRPWAKDSEQGIVPGQHSNMEAFEQASQNKPSGKTALGGEKLGYKEKMARTVSQYPGMFADENERLEALKNPDKVLNKFVNHLTDNLEWLYGQIPEQIRQQTRQWYDAANRILTEKAAKYGFSPEQAAGVIARLSPQNPWDNNLHLADRMMDIYRNQQKHPYTDEMAEKSEELRKVPTQSNAFKKMLRDIKGKKLSEIKNADPDIQAALKGLWIRLFDEAHGPDQVPSVSPTGEIVGYGSKPSWVGTDHVANAVKILQNGDIRNIHDVMGDGHKIRNFYNNLINPNSPNGHVTIDTHATAAALLSPLGPKDAEAAHTFGGTTKGIPGAPSNAAAGLTGSYPLYAEAYQRVAKKLGIQPRELQSAIWEGIKSLMGDEKKTGALKARTREIWEDAAAGKITPEQAREQIKDAAYGFSKPTWMSDEEWEKLGPESGDTGFNPEAMQQMTSLGTEHSVTADVNPASIHPELKGQPQPTPRRNASGTGVDYHQYHRDFADWANANVTPETMLTSTSHEVAHALISHILGASHGDMKIGLGHRAIVQGQPIGPGLGDAPITGVSGGFVHPGQGWAREFALAPDRQATARVLKNYLTQLMAGRAVEELLGGDPQSVHEHARGDIQMARDTMASHGIPREEMGKFIDMATEKAKRALQENWDTFQHITQQAVKHYGGDLIDSATFHKYRNGGVYETANPSRPEGGRTVNFVRNPQGAPNFGSRFAQDVEPAGRYISEVPEGTTPPKGWYAGKIHFKNPLVVDWGEGYQSGDNWKHRLSKRYGGKTGEALSEAIRKDGYDGIITVNPDGNTSEIVDLGRR